jgi:hypothetical protein
MKTQRQLEVGTMRVRACRADLSRQSDSPRCNAVKMGAKAEAQSAKAGSRLHGRKNLTPAPTASRRALFVSGKSNIRN